MSKAACKSIICGTLATGAIENDTPKKTLLALLAASQAIVTNASNEFAIRGQALPEGFAADVIAVQEAIIADPPDGPDQTNAIIGLLKESLVALPQPS